MGFVNHGVVAIIAIYDDILCWLVSFCFRVMILFQEFSSSEFQYNGRALPYWRLAVENIGLAPFSWVRMSVGLSVESMVGTIGRYS